MQILELPWPRHCWECIKMRKKGFATKAPISQALEYSVYCYVHQKEESRTKKEESRTK
jgi:hypothetical protein